MTGDSILVAGLAFVPLIAALEAVFNVTLGAFEFMYACLNLHDGGAAGRWTPVDCVILLHSHVERSLIILIHHFR